MLRDDSGNGGGRPSASRNVLGDHLEVCSMSPMTGFYRDGCCETGQEDIGSHTVCVVMTAAFLEFSKSRGNDLSTPMPQLAFAASSPATAGACVHPAGRRHSRPARRPAWSCARPTKVRWSTARSPISSASQWIWPEPGGRLAARSPERKPGGQPRPRAFITHVLPSIPSTGDNDITVLCLNESRATRLAGVSFPDHGLSPFPPNPPLRLCRAGSGFPLPARF